MLSLSAPTAVEASAASSPAPSTAPGAAATRRIVRCRRGTPARRRRPPPRPGCAPGRASRGAAVAAEAAVPAADSSADGSDVLLGLAFPLLTAQAQPVCRPCLPRQAAADAPSAAGEADDRGSDRTRQRRRPVDRQRNGRRSVTGRCRRRACAVPRSGPRGVARQPGRRSPSGDRHTRDSRRRRRAPASHRTAARDGHPARPQGRVRPW